MFKNTLKNILRFRASLDYLFIQKDVVFFDYHKLITYSLPKR